MVQITLYLPDDRIERLTPFQDRLPELLERGLQDVLRETSHYGSVGEDTTEELDATQSNNSGSAF